jgi:hypothetical protein
VRKNYRKINYQEKEEPIVEPIDLSSLDFSQEDMLKGTRTLDPVGARVEGKPHLIKVHFNKTNFMKIVYKKHRSFYTDEKTDFFVKTVQLFCGLHH